MTHRQYLIEALQIRRNAVGPTPALDEALAQLDLCIRIPCALDVDEPDPDGPEPPGPLPMDAHAAEKLQKLHAQLAAQVNAGLAGRSFEGLASRGSDLVIAATASTSPDEDPDMEGFAWLHDVLTLAAVVEDLGPEHRKSAESVLDTCWTLMEMGPDAFPSAPSVAERRFALEGGGLPEPLRRTLEMLSEVAVLRLSEWAVAEREAKGAAVPSRRRGERPFWEKVQEGVEARLLWAEVGNLGPGDGLIDAGYGEWAAAAKDEETEPTFKKTLPNGWTIIFVPQPGDKWDIQPHWDESPEDAWDRAIDIRWRRSDENEWSPWVRVGAGSEPRVMRAASYAEGIQLETQTRWSAT